MNKVIGTPAAGSAHRLKARARMSAQGRLMPQVEVVTADPDVSPRSSFSFGSMTVEHTPVGGAEGFAFRWFGGVHLLALHDMNLSDGEIFGDEGSVRRPRDLRGRLAFVPARYQTTGWYVPRTGDQSFTSLYFDPAAMSNELADSLIRVPSGPNVHFSDPYLGATMAKIRSALTTTPIPERLYLESLCLVSVLELCRLQPGQHDSIERLPSRLAPLTQKLVADYIEDHLAQDVSLDDLAALARLSRFHFVRTFKRTTQETPYQYLIRRRIERAELMLRDRTVTIEAVGRAVGFKDAGRFIRTFRRLKGITPGAYRT